MNVVGHSYYGQALHEIDNLKYLLILNYQIPSYVLNNLYNIEK